MSTSQQSPEGAATRDRRMRRYSLLGGALVAVLLIALGWVRAPSPTPQLEPASLADDGTRVEGTLSGMDSTPRLSGRRLAGHDPAQAAEETGETLDGRASVLLVKGRLVDERGDSLRGRRFCVDVRRLESDPWDRKMFNNEPEPEVLENGDFEVSFHVRSTGPSAFALFIESWRDEDANDSIRSDRLVVRDSRASELDLGVVVLHRPPLVASGTVLDPSGVGVEARVYTDEISFRGHMGTPTASTSCDARGWFELRGWIENPTITLHADYGDLEPAQREDIVPGTTGLTLHLGLSKRGEAAGVVRVDDPAMWAQMFVALATESGDMSYPTTHPTNGGEFHFASVLSGEYSLQIHLLATGEVIRTVDRVFIPARAVCEDPRVRDIDLRGALRWMRGSTVSSKVGSKRPEFFTFESDGRENTLRLESDGTWRILVAANSSDIRVVHPDGSREPLHEGMVVRVP